MIGRAFVGICIDFYRRCIRPFYFRECLFQTSCSEYVLRAGQGGLLPAVHALRERAEQCRAGYSVGHQDGTIYAITATGLWIDGSILIPKVQEELRRACNHVGASSSSE